MRPEPIGVHQSPFTGEPHLRDKPRTLVLRVEGGLAAGRARHLSASGRHDCLRTLARKGKTRPCSHYANLRPMFRESHWQSPA